MQSTESPSANHLDLDLYSSVDLVRAFIDDQLNAVAAVQAAAEEIAAAVEAAVPRIAAGGRLIYAGAGTSGRLGLLDSVELYPTFSWPDDRAIAVLAGGPPALYKAVEGAEDSREQGAQDIAGLTPTPNDVVIVLAASGTTPYALGAIEAARAVGALTIGVANNPSAPVSAAAECGITIATGAEVISGSTRLKAGTAQKIVLNTLSSSIMVKLNKVYGNLMVDVKPTNAKLIRRTINLTKLATGCSDERAKSSLESSDYHVKTAIVAILNDIDTEAARNALSAANGSVRRALRIEPRSEPPDEPRPR